MNLYFIFIVIISLIGIQFCFKNGNKDYLSKTNTSCIKGLFVLIVFYSHFTQYTKVNISKDFLMYDIKMFLGQLMVTLFLFYSGYGIFESIKNKKNYLNDFPKKRILKTWLHFVVAVFLFFILALVLGNQDLSIKRVLLSFIGWNQLGNSNWYIFAIIALYITTLVSFSIFNKKEDYRKAIVLNYILTIVLIMFLSIYKELYCYNTLLCYCAGLTYSLHKEEIEKKLFNRKKYIFILIITILSFFTLYHFKGTNFWYFEVYSIVFCLLVIELSIIINLRSKILKWYGDRLFWFYILQRIPMIVLTELGYSNHPYRFALIAFVVTTVLTGIFDYVMKYLDKFIFKEKKLLQKSN